MTTLGVGYRLKSEPSKVLKEYMNEIDYPNLDKHLKCLLTYDLAYIVYLNEAGKIDNKTASKLIVETRKLLSKNGYKLIKKEKGDLLVSRESYFKRKLENTIVGNMNYGRNRGETLHGVVPRLYLREFLLQFGDNLVTLANEIINLGEKYFNTLVPVYHHTQRAQITTATYYFTGYVPAIIRSLQRITNLYSQVNIFPLLCASSGINMFEIDERVVAELLGFSTVSSHARDVWFDDDFLSVLTTIATALNTCIKFVNDLDLWTSSEFGLVCLDDSISGTSTALPQKRNPFILKYLKGFSSLNLSMVTFGISLVDNFPVKRNSICTFLSLLVILRNASIFYISLEKL